MRPEAVALLAFALALPACASDALPEPEPDLETPGAFIAVDEGNGWLTLHRMLSSTVLESDTFVFLTVYDVKPTTWDEARDLAKMRDLPMLWEVVDAARSQFPAGPYRVVWYRSLTEEEEERIP